MSFGCAPLNADQWENKKCRKWECGKKFLLKGTEKQNKHNKNCDFDAHHVWLGFPLSHCSLKTQRPLQCKTFPLLLGGGETSN